MIFMEVLTDYLQKFLKILELNFILLICERLIILRIKINKKTRLIWLETPTNPMMNIVDISKV